jgi:hypothetical protein
MIMVRKPKPKRNPGQKFLLIYDYGLYFSLPEQGSEILPTDGDHVVFAEDYDVALARISQLEAALSNLITFAVMAANSDHYESIKQAREALGIQSETTCQHTFDIPYTRLTTAGGETGMECSKCGITNVQVGLAEHARETAPKLPPVPEWERHRKLIDERLHHPDCTCPSIDCKLHASTEKSPGDEALEATRTDDSAQPAPVDTSTFGDLPGKPRAQYPFPSKTEGKS